VTVLVSGSKEISIYHVLCNNQPYPQALSLFVSFPSTSSFNIRFFSKMPSSSTSSHFGLFFRRTSYHGAELACAPCYGRGDELTLCRAMAPGRACPCSRIAPCKRGRGRAASCLRMELMSRHGAELTFAPCYGSGMSSRTCLPWR
jgi:hypothetical protein